MMIHIHVISVGKIKETFFRQAIEEYQKRLSKYCLLSICEVPDEKIPDKINPSIQTELMQKEGKRIRDALPKESYIIALDLKGKEYSSEAFSSYIENLCLQGNSHLSFIIGGTLGLDPSVLSIAHEHICFSKMTFPHQLIRIFLLEQLFRAFKISNHETYHR